MSDHKAELKAKLLAEYEARLDELLKKTDPNDELHLDEIEEAALKLRDEVSQGVTQALVNTQQRRRNGKPPCPTCGGTTRYRGLKSKQVQTRSGMIKLDRPYYYCEACRTGFFPPR